MLHLKTRQEFLLGTLKMMKMMNVNLLPELDFQSGPPGKLNQNKTRHLVIRYNTEKFVWEQTRISEAYKLASPGFYSRISDACKFASPGFILLQHNYVVKEL